MSEIKGQTLPPPKRAEAFSLSGELSLDEILELTFEADRPLPLLTRDDVFVEGASHLLAAKAKAGKSTLLRHLAYGWAIDGHRVLYLSEEFPRTWRKRVADLEFEATGAHFRVVPALGLDPDDLLERAASGVENIVVVDTMRTLLGIPSLSNSDSATPILRTWVHRVCGPGKTLILSHHLNKRTMRTEIGEAISGAQAVQAIVDTIIEYRLIENGTDENVRVVNVRSRLLEETVEFGVRKIGPRFEVFEDELNVVLSEAEQSVYLCLDSTVPRTLKELMKATGYPEAKVRRALKDLVGRHLVRDVSGNAGRGGRGQEAAYLLLEEEADDGA